MGIFSGLENLGLGKLKNRDLYEEKNEKTKEIKNETVKKVEVTAKKTEVTEKDVLLDKTYVCPVCDEKFVAKTIRTGKLKLVGSDTDLRPKYYPADSTKYEAILCPHCGYAALNRFFERLSPTQIKMIREEICKNFKKVTINYGDTYTYDDAIMRYKIALANTVVKRAKTSERAYTCLKLAWLLRGKQETLPKDTENYENIIKELKKEENELIQNAYEGLETSFSKENFPICGMDEATASYLVADLARRSGNYDKANRWISQLITARSTPERVKEKARQIKELIKQDQEAMENNNGQA